MHCFISAFAKRITARNDIHVNTDNSPAIENLQYAVNPGNTAVLSLGSDSEACTIQTKAVSGVHEDVRGVVPRRDATATFRNVFWNMAALLCSRCQLEDCAAPDNLFPMVDASTVTTPDGRTVEGTVRKS